LITGALRLPTINFLMPSTMEEALAIFAEDADARAIAGGTNLVPGLMSHRVKAKTLVDLSGIGECRYVRKENGSIKIGALTTMGELVESPYLRGLDAISTFNSGFVSPPVMNLATIGGSVALGAYTEDMVVILQSLSAKLKMRKKNGYESVPLDKYLSSPLEDFGLVTELEFPSPRDNLFCFFDKLNMSVSRIPFASLSLKAELDGNVFSDVTIVANCAKGVTPARIFGAEDALTNTIFQKDTVAEAIKKLEQEADPHSDFMAPASYRKKALGALLGKISSRARQKVILKA
jgi:CO/xanthine dehydrogenase FAD-binding subunit